MPSYTVKSYDYQVGLNRLGPRSHHYPQYQGVLYIVGTPDSWLTIYGLRAGAMPAMPTCNAAATSGTIAVPMSELRYYVDILRNEGPVIFSLDSGGPEAIFLAAGQEPTGDGEP
jgi:hypothetical protein